MAIRDWPRSRLRRLWVWGLAAEAVLFAIPVVLGVVEQLRFKRDLAAAEARADSASAAWRRRPARERDSIRAAAAAGLDSIGIKVVTSGDTLSRFVFNDSQAVTVITRADTIRRLQMTPAAERGLGRTVAPIVTGFGRALEQLWWRFLV